MQISILIVLILLITQLTILMNMISSCSAPAPVLIPLGDHTFGSEGLAIFLVSGLQPSEI